MKCQHYIWSIFIVGFLLLNFSSKSLAPKEWLIKSRTIADSIICKLFKIDRTDLAFNFSTIRSGYLDTTLVDKKETIKHNTETFKFMSYKKGINYIPKIYYFTYELKNDITKEPYFMCIGINSNFKSFKISNINPIKVFNVQKLPDKWDFTAFIRKYNLNPCSCEIRYVYENMGNNDPVDLILQLRQTVGHAAPKNSSCDSSYIEKEIYINPWTKDLIRIVVDTNELCI